MQFFALAFTKKNNVNYEIEMYPLGKWAEACND